MLFSFADAPGCKTDRVLVVGASRGESMDVLCEVDADPPAKGFRWKFNNSGETIDIGPERFVSNGTASVLRYTPVADLDYGTLSCWAYNGVGHQSVPCRFQMVAAGKCTHDRRQRAQNFSAGWAKPMVLRILLGKNANTGNGCNIRMLNRPIKGTLSFFDRSKFLRRNLTEKKIQIKINNKHYETDVLLTTLRIQKKKNIL